MAQLTQEQVSQLKQRGLTDQRISELATQRGYDLPSPGGAQGFSTGFAKGALNIAVGTAGMLQTAGQGVLAAVDPTKTFEEIRQETGVPGLDIKKPEGQFVQQTLKSQGTAERTGEIAANIASFFIPTTKAVQVGGRALTKAGEATYKLGVGVSAKEAPLLQMYKARNGVVERIAAALSGKKLVGTPITNADTAIRKGLFGTKSMIGVQSKRAADNVWKTVIAPGLNKAKGKINFPSFIDDLSKEIEKIPELSRRADLKKALGAFIDDYKSVGDISYTQLQTFKNGWAKFLPNKAFKGEEVGAAFKEVQNLASQIARNKIYKQLGIEGKVAYFDYGNLKNLQLMGQKAMTGEKLKGGAGSFLIAIRDMALTPAATAGGLTLYKTGQGLEFIGRQGLKTVGAIFGL
ncbi:MAG: hypothetical protein WC657_06425 [Candidatus Paceibacterota bacterium]|jgi:hypothetical protein